MVVYEGSDFLNTCMKISKNQPVNIDHCDAEAGEFSDVRWKVSKHSCLAIFFSSDNSHLLLAPS